MGICLPEAVSPCMPQEKGHHCGIYERAVYPIRSYPTNWNQTDVFIWKLLVAEIDLRLQ